MIDNLIRTVMYVGMLILALSQITSIGVLLYTWGVLNVSFGLAAWTAFLFWLKAVGIAITLIVATIGLAAILDHVRR